MSHTPGPWKPGILGNPRVYGPDGKQVALVFTGRGDVNLIAAAPDLLAALEGFFEPAHLEGCLWLDDRRMPCQCGSRERVAERERAARAAISKARGAA